MKKSVKKKQAKKKVSKKKNVSNKEKEINERLVENFVSLQKVMTNMSEKFEDLSEKISKLLELFELSATALAKKEIKFTKSIDEERVMKKLGDILDQNKTIARGLTLMHDRMGDSSKPAPPIQKPAPSSKPPQVPPKSPMPKPTEQREQYKKSPFSEGI